MHDDNAAFYTSIDEEKERGERRGRRLSGGGREVRHAGQSTAIVHHVRRVLGLDELSALLLGVRLEGSSGLVVRGSLI